MSTRQPTLPFPAVDPLIASDLFFNFEHSNLGVPAIDCNCLIDSDHPEGGTLKQAATAFADTFEQLGYDAEWYIKDFQARL